MNTRIFNGASAQCVSLALISLVKIARALYNGAM